MKKTYTKKFEFEGQMVKYYNRLAKDAKIEWCASYTNKNGEYVVMWTYKA